MWMLAVKSLIIKLQPIYPHRTELQEENTGESCILLVMGNRIDGYGWMVGQDQEEHMGRGWSKRVREDYGEEQLILRTI